MLEPTTFLILKQRPTSPTMALIFILHFPQEGLVMASTLLTKLVNYILRINFHLSYMEYCTFIFFTESIFSCIVFVLWKLARQFGYKQSPPPFLTLEKDQYSLKKNILKGVNFASGGSGILRETGHSEWVSNVSLLFPSLLYNHQEKLSFAIANIQKV